MELLPYKEPDEQFAELNRVIPRRCRRSSRATCGTSTLNCRISSPMFARSVGAYAAPLVRQIIPWEQNSRGPVPAPLVALVGVQRIGRGVGPQIWGKSA